MGIDLEDGIKNPPKLRRNNKEFIEPRRMKELLRLFWRKRVMREEKIYGVLSVYEVEEWGWDGMGARFFDYFSYIC